MKHLQNIKKKLQYGDYTTLGKMLNTDRSAAKMRLERGNKVAINALQQIVSSREKLIKDFRKQNNI